MKPRNKVEEKIYQLHQRLAPISDTQKEWAREHCFSMEAYLCKDELWCNDCGKSWVLTDEEEGETITCPYCGKKLKVVRSRKKRLNEVRYLTIATAKGGYQVLRHVYVERDSLKDCIHGTSFAAVEVCQQWFDDKGRMKVIAKAMNMTATGWLWSSPLTFKRRNGQFYYGMDIYNIYGTAYPRGTFTPKLRKYGLKTSFHGVCAGQLVEALLQGNNTVESLFKVKQYAMCQFVLDRGHSRDRWIINICTRHHYIIKDASLYDDYIGLLNYFRLDTHNPHYLCPKDLKKAHDELLKKKQRRDQQERLRREKEERVRLMFQKRQDIHRFYANVLQYLDIRIEGDGITIRPLQSVAQFYQEGKAMHHCVYDCGYYGKQDSLILSARKDGQRLETIEVNLKKMKIEQSRAVCNGESPYHNEIINLVNANMELIQKAI